MAMISPRLRLLLVCTSTVVPVGFAVAVVITGDPNDTGDTLDVAVMPELVLLGKSPFLHRI